MTCEHNELKLPSIADIIAFNEHGTRSGYGRLEKNTTRTFLYEKFVGSMKAKPELG